MVYIFRDIDISIGFSMTRGFWVCRYWSQECGRKKLVSLDYFGAPSLDLERLGTCSVIKIPDSFSLNHYKMHHFYRKTMVKVICIGVCSKIGVLELQKICVGIWWGPQLKIKFNYIIFIFFNFILACIFISLSMLEAQELAEVIFKNHNNS